MSTELFHAALRIAALIAVVGLGFNLLYGVGRFINLAHGEVMLIAAFLAASLERVWSLWPAVGVTVLVFGLAGVLLGRLVLQPLRLQQSSAMLGASLGLALLLQAAWTLFTSNASVALRAPSLLNQDISLVLLVVGLALCLAAWLKYSRLGQTLRAVTGNPGLAEGWGLPVGAAYGALFGLAFAITALAGCCIAANYALSLGFAFKILVWSFAAVLVGGIGQPLGGVVAALPVALAWTILSSNGLEPYVDAILLCSCAVFYYIRPHGILGERLRLI